MTVSDVVLFSGGMDSAAILLGRDPLSTLALFFYYDQPHRGPESRCATVFARTHGYTMEAMRLPGLSRGICDGPNGSPVVPGRNATFLSVACSVASSRGAMRVWIGCTAEDHKTFHDCRPQFVRAFNNMLRASGSSVEVLAPLVMSSKRDVADLLRARGGDPDKTWSCYHPVSQMPRSNHAKPCGECAACIVRAKSKVR